MNPFVHDFDFSISHPRYAKSNPFLKFNTGKSADAKYFSQSKNKKSFLTAV